MILLPFAYLLRPIFWTPLDNRFYNYFHSKRPVPSWTQVAVVAIDDFTRADVFDNPIYPLSRHIDEHARLTEQLDAAGVRAIVFDLRLTEEDLDRSPSALVDAFRKSGKVYLVMSLTEKRNVDLSGRQTNVLQGLAPAGELLAVSKGAYVVNVQVDADGVLRRFCPDPGIEKLGLETLPEHLADFKVEKGVPIEFPSENRPIPTVSYRDVYRGDEGVKSILAGRIAFVGSTLDETADYVDVPRLQSLGADDRAFFLPGVSALAAITETLLRRAPIRDATWPIVLVWNLVWCMGAVIVMPRNKPIWAAIRFLGVLLVSLVATGLLHSSAGFVLPAGLLVGCLMFSAAFTLVGSYLETTRELVVEEVENKRVHRELELARHTQERFLPKEIPVVEGYDVFGVNISSLEVSGDYYDVVDLGQSRPLVVAIADVSGKGLPAALLMSNVQAGLHSHLFQEPFDLARTVGNLNRLVCENTDIETFVTMFIGEMEKSTGGLRYVRAGHEIPLVISAEGTARTLDLGGPVLGIVAGLAYEVGEIRLRRGDVLCLYTDGVTEAADVHDEEFQSKRLEQVLKANRGKRAREIVNNALLDVEQFTGRSRQADDVTIVVMRVE